MEFDGETVGLNVESRNIRNQANPHGCDGIGSNLAQHSVDMPVFTPRRTPQIEVTLRIQFPVERNGAAGAFLEDDLFGQLRNAERHHEMLKDKKTDQHKLGG